MAKSASHSTLSSIYACHINDFSLNHCFDWFYSKKHDVSIDDYSAFQCSWKQARLWRNLSASASGEQGASKVKNIINAILSNFDSIVIVDVGANIGQILDFISHDRNEIHMFEPNPFNREKIQAKIKDKDGAHIYPFAIANIDEKKQFFFNIPNRGEANELGSLENRGWMFGWNSSLVGRHMEVDVRRIDSVLSLSKVDFLKIDTEGLDVLAMRGGRKLLKVTDLVLWECSRSFFSAVQSSAQTDDYQAQHLLHTLGFDTFQIHPRYLFQFNGPYYHAIYDAEKPRFMNCLAIKRDYPFYDKISSNFEKIC